MTRPLQLRLRLHSDLLVDNFAGGGGASHAIEQVFGRPVDIAINHDPEAIAMHEANHPHTRHYCQDVFSVNPMQAVGGKRIALAWFSPDCKHFSKAKGGKPRSRKIRDLAWVVIRWAKLPADIRPRVICLENVAEFREWGPLCNYPVGDNGRCLAADNQCHRTPERPCPLTKGKTFGRWVSALERLGYQVDCRTLRACDYGAPTIRCRLFLVARCDGQPIVWPEPTHGDPATKAVQNGRLLPWRTAAECIDWSIPCPSIFERKRPLAENTQRRIARGVRRYVVDAPEPFIIPVSHSGDSRVHGINEPLRTITGSSRSTHALVAPTMIQTGYGERKGQAPRVPGLEKPLGTVVAGGGKHALVTAFLARNFGRSDSADLSAPACTITGKLKDALVACHLRRDFGQSVGQPAAAPLGTITAAGQGKTALVTSHLVKLYGTCQDGAPVTAPLPTVTATGQHIGEVRAFLVKYYGTDQAPGLRNPLHTITSRDRFALVTVAGEQYQIADIGMRMLTPRELFRAQGFPEHYIIDLKFRDPVTGKTKHLTKTAQVRMCGNSVSPHPAMALLRANIPATIIQPQEVAAV